MVKIAEPHSTHREVELLETLRSLGGSSRTAALAEALGVSEETIRRTVKALAKSGLLQRVHGGVYLTNKDALSPFAARLGKHAEEKSRIATQAAAMIPNGSSVFLDVGSTTAFVAERLKDHRDLTVITNALIVDHSGIYKADIGLKDGRIAAIVLGPIPRTSNNSSRCRNLPFRLRSSTIR